MARKMQANAEVFQVDGNETRILDVLLSVTYPLARQGNATAVEQVIRIMELRLRHTKQKKADEPW